MVWPAYFAANRPAPRDVATHVEALHAAHEHEHVIRLIEAALIHGQSQPWMYEVLALSMRIAGRPEAEVDRVVLSLADFGNADFGTLTYSAAYLVRLGREAAGLQLYQQASRMLPEQPAPYVLGLRLARKLADPVAIEWAACGVLQHAWAAGYAAQHREAENAAVEALALLRKSGGAAGVQRLEQALATARRRDLIVRLTWSGEADLDLLVEEPTQSICSFAARETPGGGVLVQEGFGPDPAHCVEEYVCPLAYSGQYRLRVRQSGGEVVGRRATLTIIQHQGTAAETQTQQTLALSDAEVVVRTVLADGRRTQPRPVTPAEAEEPQVALPPKRRIAPVADGRVQPAALEYEASRTAQAGVQVRRTGAVGFQPVIQIIPDGATFSAQAVVSPDRRYVRIGVSPVFTNLTDVFTFTFVGGAPAGGGGQPGN